jgi:hypothetical protein
VTAQLIQAAAAARRFFADQENGDGCEVAQYALRKARAAIHRTSLRRTALTAREQAKLFRKHPE